MRNLLAILLLMSMVVSAVADPIESIDTTRGVVVGGKNGLLFATGGIGMDQQQALSKIAPDCNLRLTFSKEKTGEYLADVIVNIQTGEGEEVFDVGNAGPLFYTKLPPGKYIVTVDWHGKQQKKEIGIPKTGAEELYFYWPE